MGRQAGKESHPVWAHRNLEQVQKPQCFQEEGALSGSDTWMGAPQAAGHGCLGAGRG